MILSSESFHPLFNSPPRASAHSAELYTQASFSNSMSTLASWGIAKRIGRHTHILELPIERVSAILRLKVHTQPLNIERHGSIRFTSVSQNTSWKALFSHHGRFRPGPSQGLCKMVLKRISMENTVEITIWALAGSQNYS